MSLRPEFEALIRAAEEEAEAAGIASDRQAAEADALCRSIDESIDNLRIPQELFDDPSVVKHREDLSRTGIRVKRETRQMAAAAPVAARRR